MLLGISTLGAVLGVLGVKLYESPSVQRLKMEKPKGIVLLGANTLPAGDAPTVDREIRKVMRLQSQIGLAMERAPHPSVSLTNDWAAMGRRTLAELTTLEAQALMLQLQIDLNLIVRTATEEAQFNESLDRLFKELGGPPVRGPNGAPSILSDSRLMVAHYARKASIQRSLAMDRVRRLSDPWATAVFREDPPWMKALSTPEPPTAALGARASSAVRPASASKR